MALSNPAANAVLLFVKGELSPALREASSGEMMCTLGAALVNFLLISEPFVRLPLDSKSASDIFLLRPNISDPSCDLDSPAFFGTN
jgi:hypothetical protein